MISVASSGEANDAFLVPNFSNGLIDVNSGGGKNYTHCIYSLVLFFYHDGVRRSLFVAVMLAERSRISKIRVALYDL